MKILLLYLLFLKAPVTTFSGLASPTDFLDAEVIVEAVDRRNLRFVPIIRTISWICKR